MSERFICCLAFLYFLAAGLGLGFFSALKELLHGQEGEIRLCAVQQVQGCLQLLSWSLI